MCPFGRHCTARPNLRLHGSWSAHGRRLGADSELGLPDHVRWPDLPGCPSTLFLLGSTGGEGLARGWGVRHIQHGLILRGAKCCAVGVVGGGWDGRDGWRARGPGGLARSKVMRCKMPSRRSRRTPKPGVISTEQKPWCWSWTPDNPHFGCFPYRA